MIVTLGESMMVFNGPPAVPISTGASLQATFAGAESNVAIGLARLGHSVRHLTVLGDDPFGHTIFKSLRGEGIDVSGAQMSPAHPTGVMFKNRWPGHEPEVFYYRNTSAFAHADITTFDPALWREANLIYLTGITPALSSTCLALFNQVIDDAQAHNIPVWLDPNYRKKLWRPEAFRQTITACLPKIDTILPGLSEGQMLTDKSDPGEIACKLMGMGAKNVILKGGHSKAAAYTTQGTASHQASPLDCMIDPIGAGDAFAAGYLAAHLDALPPADCLKQAHATAAIVCMTHGDWEGLPTRGQLERFIGPTRDAHR
jgi:2-dehydro-3-deoxygluconokinase